MRCLVGLVLLAACYAPAPQLGSPCDADHPCPAELVCAATGTCERSDIDAPTLDSPPVVADAQQIDGCTPTGFDVCGDGIDQDCDGADAVCVANDLAGGAIDITAGGAFTSDLLRSHDDLVQKGCGNTGGREVFYAITLAAPQVYYLDTFGSNFDTIVRVFPGKTCPTINPNATPSCNDDACSTSASQLALSLPTGTSCVVIDQSATESKGALVLHVTVGGRDGTALASGPSTVTGNTCTSTNSSDPDAACSDGTPAKDRAYFFTACPAATAHVDASTCTNVANTHFDTVVYVLPAGGTDIACVDDSSTCAARPDRTDGHPDGSILTNVPAPGPGLFWLVVDGYDTSACGGYQLDTNLH